MGGRTMDFSTGEGGRVNGSEGGRMNRYRKIVIMKLII
jgi:hypothetical protein